MIAPAARTAALPGLRAHEIAQRGLEVAGPRRTSGQRAALVNDLGRLREV